MIKNVTPTPIIVTIFAILRGHFHQIVFRLIKKIAQHLEISIRQFRCS